MANLSDQKYAATFIRTENATKSQINAPPSRKPMPMKSAVSAASSSQVLALLVQLAWVTFIWWGLLSTARKCTNSRRFLPPRKADTPGPRGRSDECARWGIVPLGTADCSRRMGVKASSTTRSSRLPRTATTSNDISSESSSGWAASHVVGRLVQAGDLLGPDHLQRIAVAFAALRLHLAEHQPSAAPHDEIDLVAACPDVAPERRDSRAGSSGRRRATPPAARRRECYAASDSW